jgi:hypothetical protein
VWDTIPNWIGYCALAVAVVVIIALLVVYLH